MKKNTSLYFRLIHRYLGFYLVGVMAVYAISGTIMIFRKTDTFKKVTEVETQIKPQLSEKSLGKVLKIKNLEITKTQGDLVFFKEGQYNLKTGDVAYLKKELPLIIEKCKNFTKQLPRALYIGLTLFLVVHYSFLLFLPSGCFYPKLPSLKKGFTFL